MTAREILYGLLEESKGGVVVIPLPTISTTEQAENTQRYWASIEPGLCFDLEIKAGRWYLLVSYKAQARRIPYDA